MLNKETSELRLALHKLVIAWDRSNNDKDNDSYWYAITILNKYSSRHNVGKKGPMGNPGTCRDGCIGTVGAVELPGFSEGVIKGEEK
jgi:hypothetical protein